MSLIRFTDMLIKTQYGGKLCPVLFGATNRDGYTLLTYTGNLDTMKQTFDVPQTRRIRELVRRIILPPENVLK